jgi:hypothetical protein
VQYADEPPSWGTFRESAPPPDGFIIGSDSAFGWPLPCMWYQVMGKLAGDLTVGYSTAGSELRGGWFLNGEVDSRGRDFHAFPLRPIWSRFLVNVALYAMAWWLLLFGLPRGRRMLRRRRGACPMCAYDLKGQPDRGCPECGWNRPAACGG